MARGEGACVEDVDGNVFLDCTAGIAVTATGHSHPDVVQAIVEQAGKFLHMSGTDFYYEPQVRLGEELSAIAPMPGPHRSFFGNSGTEANEAAIKLARYYTKRHNIIAFFGAFHGRTMGSLSLTASKLTQRRGFGPFVPGVVSRAVRQLLSLSGRPSSGDVRGRVPALHRRAAARAPRGARRSRGDHRRADSGRGRLRRAAGRLPSAAA